MLIWFVVMVFILVVASAVGGIEGFTGGLCLCAVVTVFWFITWAFQGTGDDAWCTAEQEVTGTC